MKNKYYILIFDPMHSDNWEALVAEYKHRASEAKGGYQEIHCDRWYPANKLKNLLDALGMAKTEALENLQIYLHCQDILLSETDINYIHSMANEFGVIATTEYGVIE